jgi:ATP-dependent Clp protease, protease subunit
MLFRGNGSCAWDVTLTPFKVRDILNRMMELSLQSNEEIRLHIDSNGGSLRAALQLYYSIRGMKLPVTGIVVGSCHSAAILVLQGCVKRLAFSNANFLLHYASISIRDTISIFPSIENARAKFERELTENIELQASSEKILAERTNKGIEEIRQAMQNGELLCTYLSSAEAVTFGLIDDIVEDSAIHSDKK